VTAAEDRTDLDEFEADFDHFTRWCEAHQAIALPAEAATVARYLTDIHSDYRVATLTRRIAAISVVHQRHGLASPTREPVVREVMRGIRRSLGTAQAQVEPLLVADLRRILAHLPEDLPGTRDRALLLVGFAGALRRSELVALDVTDLADAHDGIILTVRRSKTDQEAAGRQVALPYGADTCPVAALRTWLERAAITDGAVFRPVNRHRTVSPDRLSDRAVALVVKRRAQAAGLDPTRLSGHSLRAGHATTAAANGATERQIANQTGHRSMEVLRRYIRQGTIFNDNGTRFLGL